MVDVNNVAVFQEIFIGANVETPASRLNLKYTEVSKEVVLDIPPRVQAALDEASDTRASKTGLPVVVIVALVIQPVFVATKVVEVIKHPIPPIGAPIP
jgi:hypothetical protein